MTREARLELLTRYYDACSTGDVDAMIGCFHPDVIHYFLAPNVGSRAVGGAEHLARYWRKVAALIQGVWVVDRLVEAGDEAVIEWTMFWNPEGSADRVHTRGAEWFVLEDGRIREIRSYYQQPPATTELDGFAYDARGYSVAGRERSDLHRPVLDGAPA
jgi:ketosteroid isomerase-like protein